MLKHVVLFQSVERSRRELQYQVTWANLEHLETLLIQTSADFTANLA